MRGEAPFLKHILQATFLVGRRLISSSRLQRYGAQGLGSSFFCGSLVQHVEVAFMSISTGHDQVVQTQC